MSDAESFVDTNRAMWDERAPARAASPDYGFDAFAGDPSHISGVVAFDRPLPGSVAGASGVHLQCHIGTDTVSLARLGAHMSGLDFSGPALDEARRLAAIAGADVDFVRAEVYEALDVLPRSSFDLVYTGIGAIIWLPSIDRWAEVVTGLLRPGGRLFMREGHPVLYAVAEPRPDGLSSPSSIRTGSVTRWNDAGTYVSTETTFKHSVSVEWNHGLGEIVTALLDRGMELTTFVEHDTIPWDALPGYMVEIGGGEFRLRDRPERLPHSYTMAATKRG